MKLNNDNRFDIDLEYGQIFEQKIADIFQNSKIEVKTERDKWNSTGNIVIEFESRGHPSGIAITEADFWFHNLALKGELIMTLVFPVPVLKRYIADNKPRVVRGGDDNTSKLYLINLADLVTIIE
ncbi:MAG: hypothetical protein EBR60_06805 [Burkholderiaceae bacterium]|nr:hypothetical protein [Burkholderiaceae bacterium]